MAFKKKARRIVHDRNERWKIVEGNARGLARVILVLRECIWNALRVSLVLPAFDDTVTLGSPPCLVFYSPG